MGRLTVDSLVTVTVAMGYCVLTDDSRGQLSLAAQHGSGPGR